MLQISHDCCETKGPEVVINGQILQVREGGRLLRNILRQPERTLANELKTSGVQSTLHTKGGTEDSKHRIYAK